MIEQEQNAVLFLLKAVDFDWVMHMKSVWRDSNYDVKDLHQEQRSRVIHELDQIRHKEDANSPLGLVLVGAAGAGKTHLISAVRQYALSQGFGFVLVDMTDVRDFWETVLQGYLSSLQEISINGISQFQLLIDFLISDTGFPVSRSSFSQANASELKQYINSILAALAKRDRRAIIRFQNTVRGLFLLNSDDFVVSGIGYNWLQGVGIEEEDRATFGFSVTSENHLSNIVEGLSWLMSLRSPSVVAFDQLDSIVTQHHFAAGTGSYTDLSDEQRVSRAIIEGIAGGLTALRDKTARTLILLSCLETTWEILRKQAAQPFKDRFHQPLLLDPVCDASVAEQIVESRLREVYDSVKFSPPYSTWPFTKDFFESAKQQYPRRILQRCDAHRRKCLIEKKITEISSFDGDTPPCPTPSYFDQLDKDFASLRAQGNLTSYLDEGNEDTILATLLQTAGECLLEENPTADNVDVAVETDFPGGHNYRLLHTRVRLIFRDEGDREQHLCLRALQRENPKAYQARLKAAMTASGIDHSLSFRRLIIIRTHAIPGGAVTQKLTEQFEQAGGLFANPTEDELRTLLALQELRKKKDQNFEAWLRDRRPVSQLPFMQDAVHWLFGEIPGKSTETEIPTPASQIRTITHPSKPSKSTTESVAPQDIKSIPALQLPIGARLVGQQIKDTISIPVQALTKHTVILAGTGAGKTVLVRRLVEEAVLLGIPAIVIDCANDLARMGDRWTTPQELGNDEDRQKAELYHQKSQVVVWTPGREVGNPLNLEPLPDLAAVANDPEELNQAADMARDALQDIVAPGKAQASVLKRGILKAALLYFARDGGGRLPDLIELLSDLPPDAGGGIADAGKKAQAMADSLRAEILNNPLLRQSGSALDPAILFGLDQSSEKTRISILNFVGLSSLGAQQQFLNQLFMTLFTWIKKNPAPTNKPIRGLLVLDEAKDFVPSTGSTPCKASLNRLVAQARKYGLGLIFATQAPKSIDHNIIANCSTQFYGKANSPAAIAVIQEQLHQRGGGGQDIARLEKGQFYAVSESLTSPTKILTPLCLSHHPPTPLDEVEVLNRARSSRNTK